MKIAEIYRSRQGEGSLTGADSVFIRTSGCNLRCWFCDTPYTSWTPEGEERSLDEVAVSTLAHDAEHVVITGGEPLLWAEMARLTRQLRAAGRHITIETAGTVYQPVDCQLMSISPKLRNSTPVERDPRWAERHERVRRAPDVMRRLLADYECQLKFVVDQPSDVAEVSAYIAEFAEIRPDQVWLMPQGTRADELAAKAAWLEPEAQRRGWRYCRRMQIEWYGNRRGT